jgi:hypothetical protein
MSKVRRDLWSLRLYTTLQLYKGMKTFGFVSEALLIFTLRLTLTAVLLLGTYRVGSWRNDNLYIATTKTMITVIFLINARPIHYAKSFMKGGYPQWPQPHLSGDDGGKGGGRPQTTSKTPPPWNNIWIDTYPFTKWIRDLGVWATATEVPEERRAGALVLQLGGEAPEKAMGIPPEILMHGDGTLTGTQIVVRMLGAIYAPMDEEIQIHAITQFFHFRRHPTEAIDSLISRFETSRMKVESEGEMFMGITGT